jgi:predicted nuclease of predicted toxin-antitoxin system
LQQKFPACSTPFSQLKKMPEYLIDVNLPYYFSLWNSDNFIHQKDIDDTASDDEIWNYAKQNELIIITKDKDFSLMQLMKGAPPKVIQIKFRNVKMNVFFEILINCWNDVEMLIEKNNLVNIYKNKIEALL